MNLAFIGMAAALGLSASGSAFGAGFAGQAAVGAWKKCYASGKPAPFIMIAFAGAPLTQTIYGFLLMNFIKSAVDGGADAGLALGVGLFCGLSRKFAVKYSLLMSIPAVIGAFFVEMGEFTAVSMTVGKGFTYVLGMLVAGITGYLVIRFMLKLSNQVRLRYFAFYSFAAGILILAANYI